MKKINAKKALFIKLGSSGDWERDCIENGTLRLGYVEVPHERCIEGDWEGVRNAFPYGSNPGAVTRHINQIRQFYEEPSDTLWITFYSDRLWWCFSKPEIEQLPDKTKIRKVIGRWSDEDINGTKLSKGRLSGKLLAAQGYRGTICSIGELTYLLHKINGTTEPYVAEAQLAVENLERAIIPIIKKLHPKDLEIFTDLIFRQAGWQRIGMVGEVNKDIDLDLLSPITQERIAVQVKSSSSVDTYKTYHGLYSEMTEFSRFYFVTHSPDSALIKETLVLNEDSFVYWGPEQLAQQAVRNGLVGWLIDKAS